MRVYLLLLGVLAKSPNEPITCLVSTLLKQAAYQTHPHRIISNRCRKNTVVSADDGLIVAPNM